MKVFISHSWNDKSLATEINETLKNDGHEVWYDVHQLIPGDNIQNVIDNYIQNCEVVVLVWTKYAFTSTGVGEEIQTALKAGKRIIPLQADDFDIDYHPDLKGVLGIPFEDKATGMLLLQRGLLMLMASENYKEAAWFKEAFGNVVDLGGYLNYTNTYRLSQNKNEDGHKEIWAKRLEILQQQNEHIRTHIMPQAQDKLQQLQNIMNQLQNGDASLDDLKKWRQWCIDNKDFQPGVVNQFKGFIEKDIIRITETGSPAGTSKQVDSKIIIRRLTTAIAGKKDSAYKETFVSIKKYAGFLIGDKIIDSIVSSYIKYVSNSPVLLQELVNESSISEYVAVKETTDKLLRYLENQEHEKELQRPKLEGYFDDAYLITNTIKLLIEAKLVNKERYSLDFIVTNVIDKYVGFLLQANTKAALEKILLEIRDLIGLKKNEINWGKVAAIVIGAAIVGSAADALFDGVGGSEGFIADSGGGIKSPFFEDQVASFSAKYGAGLDAYVPVQY